MFRVAKLRSATSCRNTVMSILYPDKVDDIENIRFIIIKHNLSFIHFPLFRYGKDNEKFALADLSDILSDTGQTVENCGLYVDTKKCFLAASPDGVVGAEAVVEVKCPLKCVDTRLDWLAKHDPTFCLQTDLITGGLRLKRNHDYYYQVQGQMHITKRLTHTFPI